MCGIIFRKKDRYECAIEGRRDTNCPGRRRIQEQMHSSHDGRAARTAGGKWVTFCSACGAYGSAKAVILKEKCEKDSACKRLA